MRNGEIFILKRRIIINSGSILLFVSFPTSMRGGGRLHWSPSDSKHPPFSKTHHAILDDLNTIVCSGYDVNSFSDLNYPNLFSIVPMIIIIIIGVPSSLRVFHASCKWCFSIKSE